MYFSVLFCFSFTRIHETLVLWTSKLFHKIHFAQLTRTFETFSEKTLNIYFKNTKIDFTRTYAKLFIETLDVYHITEFLFSRISLQLPKLQASNFGHLSFVHIKCLIQLMTFHFRGFDAHFGKIHFSIFIFAFIPDAIICGVPIICGQMLFHASRNYLLSPVPRIF